MPIGFFFCVYVFVINPMVVYVAIFELIFKIIYVLSMECHRPINKLDSDILRTVDVSLCGKVAIGWRFYLHKHITADQISSQFRTQVARR